jgi:hypothetical protein
MEIDKGGCWSVAIFKWEEGEEARQLHDVGGEWHSEERCDAQEVEGSGWHLEVKDDQRKLGRWPNCWLDRWKNMIESMSWEKEYWRQECKRKKKIKTGKDFWAAKN